ncbi:MAG: GNAT family N-acetyltransferase [Roseibium sp.]
MTPVSNCFRTRPVENRDFFALAELYQHLIPDDVPATEAVQSRTFEKMLAQPGMTILLGLAKELPVATCTVIVVPNFTRGCASYAIIENVVTHQDHRSKGYGEHLMQAAADLAWKAGCYKIMLMSGTKNTKAHRFYERVGFATTKVGFELRAPGFPSREIRR